ncbi:MAG TPA: isochorismatase family protein [Nonomuraea sp.]|nr:isochorismatase family protein [Nonomuraea sp.]
MSLPSIAPYAMPDPPAYPATLHLPAPERSALLIHDMQGYFLRPFTLDAPPLADLLANVLALRQTCAEAGIPVLYSVQPGQQSPAERGLLMELWGPGPSADPADTDLPAALIPAPGDQVIVKRRYSAFHRTPLAHTLAELGRDQLLICGVYAHIGILATALEAFMLDIQPFVVADAVADFSADDHHTALGYISRRCGRTPATSQVIAALRTARQLAPTTRS